jgi:hypothetical protein
VRGRTRRADTANQGANCLPGITWVVDSLGDRDGEKLKLQSVDKTAPGSRISWVAFGLDDISDPKPGLEKFFDLITALGGNKSIIYVNGQAEDAEDIVELVPGEGRTRISKMQG